MNHTKCIKNITLLLDYKTLLYYKKCVIVNDKILYILSKKEYILNGNLYNTELTNFYTFSIIWDNLR